MISENQELLKAEARVATVEQKIEFRAKGKHGNLMNELAKAKKVRDELLFSITNNSSESKELIGQALKLVDNSKIRKEKIKEIEKELNKLSLFMDLMENGIPKWDGKQTPKPNLDYIGIKIRKENQERLENIQPIFDRIKLRTEKSSPVGRGGKTGELQRARNDLNSILERIEKQESLIEFYELRKIRDWKLTTIKEKKVEIEFYQIELAKAEKILDGF